MSEEAKNKAIELVRHFKGRGMDGDENYASKECATIVVDEIISYHNSLFDAGLKEVHIALSSPIKTYVDVLNPKLKFWQEVKNQIKSI